MLKIRLQGTTKDLKWFKKILERTEESQCCPFPSHLPIKAQINIFVCMPMLRKIKNRRRKSYV